jgi:hypothetical protein
MEKYSELPHSAKLTDPGTVALVEAVVFSDEVKLAWDRIDAGPGADWVVGKRATGGDRFEPAGRDKPEPAEPSVEVRVGSGTVRGLFATLRRPFRVPTVVPLPSIGFGCPSGYRCRI